MQSYYEGPIARNSPNALSNGTILDPLRASHSPILGFATPTQNRNRYYLRNGYRRVKLRTSNLTLIFTGSIWTKAHQKFCRKGGVSVRENVVSHSKKVKSHVFWILKKMFKNVKNVRSFTGHLITQPLITPLPEVSTGKSRSPTSNILLRSVDGRSYATENCVW